MAKPQTPTISVSNIRGTLVDLASSAYSEGPTSFPLDAYETNLSIVFSLRRELTSFGGSAIRVRRETDDDELDIGFDSNGLLDTTTLLSFAGIVGATRVKTWYDQGPNSFDVSNAAEAGQPAIVSSGSIQMLNGKPAIFFDGNESLSRANVSTLTAFSADQLDFYAVLEQFSDQQRNNLLEHNNGSYTDRTAISASYDNTIIFDSANVTAGSGRISVAQPTGWDNAQHLLMCTREPTTATIRVDGVDLTSGAQTGSRAAGSYELIIGRGLGNFDFHRGRVQTLFWHRQNRSGNDRAAIEAELASHYGIILP